MENFVIGSKYLNSFFVKYPYGGHLDFFASSPVALSDGLKNIKYSYAPKVYRLITYTSTPKFKVLTKKELEQILSHYS